MSDPLSVRHIEKSFQFRRVLKGVTFTLAEGQTIILFGRNGVGKTTLLKILAGIMRPDRGSANLHGWPLFSRDGRWRREIAYLGHRPGLYPALTARENMQLSVELRDAPWDERAFGDLLETYGLEGRDSEPLRTFSEGMLQRLGILRLALADWRLGLLDEPAASLDADGTELLLAALKRWTAMGRTVLVATQDLHFGAQCAGRALLLSGGIIEADLNDPQAESLATALGERG